MKKLSLILAMLILSLAMISCSKSDPNVPEGMQLCTNDVVNYNLYVPEDWTPSISTGAVGAYCSNADPSNVTVMAWNVDASMTLDDWWVQYREDFDLTFDDFILESSDTTTLGGVAAKKYTYTAKLAGYDYCYTQCACLHWGMVYVLTFTSTPEHVADHAEDISNIINYFEFH